MPKVNSREYRSLSVLQAVISKRMESDYYVEGYATTFGQAYTLYEFDGIKYLERIDSHALDHADMSDVIMQYNHSGKVLARKSNATLIVEPNNKGLFIAADLSKSPAAKEMHEEIDNGLITRMSWAFIVEEDQYNKETRTRTITKIKKVYDVSAVSIPANDDTEISARSYFDGVIEVEKQELLGRRKRRLKLMLKLEENYE